MTGDEHNEVGPEAGTTVPVQQFVLLAKAVKGARAAEIIHRALDAPGIYLFREFMDLPNIKELAEGEHAMFWNLLNIFAFGTYKDYVQAENDLPPLSVNQKKKLQQLTIISLSEQDKCIPYKILLEELDISDQRELEGIILEAIYAEIIRGKLDQSQSLLEVEKTIGRDTRPETTTTITAIIENPSESWCSVVRSVSPVFHLPPPVLEDETETENISGNEEVMQNNSDGIPVITKVEDESSKVDGNGDIVFCRCCGCFGLSNEFFEQVYCTRACSHSYDLHMSKGPDGKFRKPITPVLNKKPKLSIMPDTNHSTEMGTTNNCEPIIESDSFPETENFLPNNNSSIQKKQSTTVKKSSESKSFVDGNGKLKGGSNKPTNGVINSNTTNNKKGVKRKADVPSKEFPVPTIQQRDMDISPSKALDLTRTKSDDTQLRGSAPRSPDMVLRTFGSSGTSVRGIQRTKSLELPGIKVFAGNKSTAFYSKDRKRNFPQVLSRRMPVKASNVSERRMTESVGGNDTPEMTDTSGRTPNNGDFDWQKYLAETKGKSVPHRLFRYPAMPPKNPFRVGMLLESIDPQHQSLICVVRVVEIQGYRLRLRFQGFSEAYDYWVNADSLDIFYPGWCEENNLDLEPPAGVPSPFNWHTYIVETQADVAPRNIFAVAKEDFPRPGELGVNVAMKLEAVDIRNQNLVCVATVAKVMGDRILVHFDSWDSLYDYWTDLTSPFIHPVGWCEKNNVKLIPPNYCKPDFSWEKYLRETNSVAMPARLFRPLPPVGFRKGFKIECVDKRNPFLVRVATIAEVEDHQLQIHFDNWPQLYDYKVYELSPDIHPVGWCAHTGHPLQPPPPPDGRWTGPCNVFGCLGLGHMRGPKFLTHNSDKYCPYALHNYKKDWILADRLILLERSMLHNHGDSSSLHSSSLELSQQTHDNSRDTGKADQEGAAHSSSSVTGNATITSGKVQTIKRKRNSVTSTSPVKKRKRVNGKANGPPNHVNPNSRGDDDKKNIELVRENVSQTMVFGTVVEEPKIKTEPEINVKLEGYETNDQHEVSQIKNPLPPPDTELKTTEIKIEPSSLLVQSSSPPSSVSSSTNTNLTTSVQNQTEPIIQHEDPFLHSHISQSSSSSGSVTSTSQFDTGGSLPSQCGAEEDEGSEDKLRRISLPSTSTSSAVPTSNNNETESELPYNYAVNSMSLKVLVGNIDEKTVSQWEEMRLAEFIGTIPGCQTIANTFMEQLIDGESFLMLSQQDFIKVMGLKLGPAIKLSNVIRMIISNTNVTST